MGTSTKYRGPVGGSWTRSRGELTRLGRKLSDTIAAGDDRRDGIKEAQKLLDSERERIGKLLREALANDPESAGIAAALTEQAKALIDVLDGLRTAGLEKLGPLPGDTAEDRELAFITEFVRQTAPAGDTVADHVQRRSAAACAQQLLDRDHELADSVHQGTSSEHRISSELLCSIYAFFFGDAVTGFLQRVVAEHMKAAIPVLYLDPTGRIADWISKKIVSVIPNPCEEQAKQFEKAVNVADTARELIGTAVSCALDFDQVDKEAA